MRIAFYAPLKPPDHSVPSGDRRMARLLMQALELAGHDVEVACRLRSRDGLGDPARQQRLSRLGERLAASRLRRYRAREAAERPAVWFTYHLYYKAPDWIGPRVAAGLGIPYVAAEASLAMKRAGGRWALGHEATVSALDQAAAVITLNPVDAECLSHVRRVHPLPPFLDTAPFAEAAAERPRHRKRLADRHGLDPKRHWLLVVAMMRDGDKLQSFRLLAGALRDLGRNDWQLLIVGDGPARDAVEAAFADFPTNQVQFLGERHDTDLPPLYAAADLYVWPAVNEAFGMSLLEAQAAALPVVAGNYGGVSGVVHDGLTGRLTPPGDRAAFAACVSALLDDAPGRTRMARATARHVEATHGLGTAARSLDNLLREVVRQP